jgi:hypothetical protein
VFHRISGDGIRFRLPHREGERMRSLVSWSRLFTDQEVLLAINTDEAQPVTAYSTVAPPFRVEGDEFHLIYWHAPKSATPPPPSLKVERVGGLLTVAMTLPPAGFAIYLPAPGLGRMGPSPAADLRPWHPPHVGDPS